MLYLWFPNGPPDLTPEEWAIVRRRIFENVTRRLAWLEWEMTNRDLFYLMGLPEHMPGDCDVMEN